MEQNVAADLGSLDGKKGQAVLIEARVPAQKAASSGWARWRSPMTCRPQGIKARSVKTDLFVTFTA